MILFRSSKMGSGCGTFTFWLRLYLGYETCTECVPFGLSTYRFLFWPLSDAFLCFLCLSTGFLLIKTSRFAFLSGVTLGFNFCFMAILALYMDVFVRTEEEGSLQPLFLNVWFMGWGGFMLWFLHHWRTFFTSAKASYSSLPNQRKTGAI